MTYEPSHEHLERYAQLLVGYALGGGNGIARGDVVLVVGPDNTKPLFAELCRAVWRAGGHVIQDFRPADDAVHNLGRDFYELATDEQLEFFPEHYYRGGIDQADHLVFIKSDADPQALRDVPPDKIMRHQQSFMPLIEWQAAKEAENRFTWTIGMYGTEAMASEAGLSIEDYWREIVAACYLDEPDPAARWREVNAQIEGHCEFLNSLPIDRLHVEGEDADLWITLGEQRRWIGGGGKNIPSFEVFTGPDWRGTEGWIRFSEPLYVYGSLIKGVELRFTEGRVVSASAEQNEDLLEADGQHRGRRPGRGVLADRRAPIADQALHG